MHSHQLAYTADLTMHSSEINATAKSKLMKVENQNEICSANKGIAVPLADGVSSSFAVKDHGISHEKPLRSSQAQNNPGLG